MNVAVWPDQSRSRMDLAAAGADRPRFFDWRRVPNWRDLPRVDGPRLRAQLIASGQLLPLGARPTLRMDDAGRKEHARAMRHGLAHPETQWEPYHPEPPPGDWSHLPDED